MVNLSLSVAIYFSGQFPGIFEFCMLKHFKLSITHIFIPNGYQLWPFHAFRWSFEDGNGQGNEGTSFTTNSRRIIERCCCNVIICLCKILRFHVRLFKITIFIFNSWNLVCISIRCQRHFFQHIKNSCL